MSRRWKWSALGAVAVMAALTACEDYLSGPDLTTDPNRPTEASVDQLFHAVQVRMFTQHEGHLARVTGMWMQQFAGTGQQYIALDAYDITEADFSPQFSAFYTGGGLVDLRQVQEQAEEQGDRIFAGMAKVIEAYNMGTAASIWGAIPYSQAVNPENPTPELDSQSEVYAAVQVLLDEAIADLASGEGREPGPADLMYGGDTEAWIEVANTLSARFHLHWAGVDPTRYQQAYDAAQEGISSPENNFVAQHSSTAGEENIWFQFHVRERDAYMRGGEFLINLLQERDDPRLEEYFATGANGEFVGAAPASGFTDASRLSAERADPGFDQPLVTWAENQLIMAEAAANGAGGGEGEALELLNEVRAEAGLDAVSASGDELLEEILTEKYIATFQTLEPWNDYKRTCFPEIEPIAGEGVPGRLLYGEAERNVNPNIPAPSEQPARNENDPGLCTAGEIGDA